MNGRATRPIDLLCLPFHSGRLNEGMGRGPTQLLENLKLAERLEEAGLSVRVEVLDKLPDEENEIAATIELDRRLARRVRAAVSQDVFPLVVSGNCNSCLGTVAGVTGASGTVPGVIWFDAHADFDTPDENLSGFFDVMGLSILTGGCWVALGDSIPAFRSVSERDVVLAGVRDLEPYQRTALAQSQVQVVWGEEIRGRGIEAALSAKLEELGGRTSDVYLHVDLDCLDPAEGRANQYAAPGGLTLDELRWAIDEIGGRFHVVAAALTAYDPDLDGDGRAGQAAVSVAQALAGVART